MHRRLVHHEEQERAMNKSALSILLLTLSALAHTAQAAELGRLFFTPQQRQQLEYQGANGGNSSAESERHSYIIVNGVVQKKGGNRTVWINGKAQPAERGNDKNPTVEPVIVPGKSQPIHLKVG